MNFIELIIVKRQTFVWTQTDIVIYQLVKTKPVWYLSTEQGYCEDPTATANAFCGDYYLTGDRGIQDEDGYFWFFSRQDDLIISSGYRIGPFEVESALIEHEAVKESAVVPSPDSDRGQVVKAFVVLSDKYRHVLGDETQENILKGWNFTFILLHINFDQTL